MKKKLFTVILSTMMVFGLAMNAAASTSEGGMMITHPEAGVTEGSREETCTIINGVYYQANGAKGAYVEYVGNGNDDKGPWEHGVTTSGLVYSNYKNLKYWHGSSARGSGGLVRSELVAKNIMSYASVQTTWLDGNHSYWRVDTNKK